MGNFKIVIEAVGGHGVDRKAKNGDVVNFYAEGSQTPDALAKTFYEMLKWMGFDVKNATLIHWPEEPGEVKDNLVTGIRTGNF
jgi:hypothetical protein